MNIDLTSEVVWIATGTLIGLASFIWGVGRWIINTVTTSFDRQIDTLRDENRQLRDEIDRRFQLPKYALEAIEVTEEVADRKIAQLEARHRKALDEHNEEAAEALNAQLEEIQRLRAALEQQQGERQEIEQQLERAILAPPVRESDNAVGLRTGFILLVRHEGRFGAVQAVDQAGRDRGAFIRYVWWYQPDGSGSFINVNAQSGFSSTHEEGNHAADPPSQLQIGPGRPTNLNVGPIVLEWSMGGDGFGWVYYGPSSTPTAGYELCLTHEVDITSIDAIDPKYDFQEAPALSNRSDSDS